MAGSPMLESDGATASLRPPLRFRWSPCRSRRTTSLSLAHRSWLLAAGSWPLAARGPLSPHVRRWPGLLHETRRHVRLAAWDPQRHCSNWAPSLAEAYSCWAPAQAARVPMRDALSTTY